MIGREQYLKTNYSFRLFSCYCKKRPFLKYYLWCFASRQKSFLDPQHVFVYYSKWSCYAPVSFIYYAKHMRLLIWCHPCNINFLSNYQLVFAPLQFEQADTLWQLRSAPRLSVIKSERLKQRKADFKSRSFFEKGVEGNLSF